jgi:hypothetical protein
MVVEVGMNDAEIECTIASGGRTAHFSDMEAYVMYALLQEFGKGEGSSAAAAREMAARIPSRISKFFYWVA